LIVPKLISRENEGIPAANAGKSLGTSSFSHLIAEQNAAHRTNFQPGIATRKSV